MLRQKEDEFYYWFRIKKETQIIIQEKDYENGIKYIESKFSKIENLNIKIIFDLANFYKNSKNYKKACSFYLKSLKKDSGKYDINIKMTLTAPGCGMGPVIAQDVESKVLGLSFVEDVLVEVVWEPLWNQNMMTEEARLKLGML